MTETGDHVTDIKGHVTEIENHMTETTDHVTEPEARAKPEGHMTEPKGDTTDLLVVVNNHKTEVGSHGMTKTGEIGQIGDHMTEGGSHMMEAESHMRHSSPMTETSCGHVSNGSPQRCHMVNVHEPAW